MEGIVFELVKDFFKSAVEKIGSGLLSCIVDQWKENASRDDNMEWFKIVLCDLEAVLEETSDLPITSIPLRRQLKYLKGASKDWRDQVDHEEMGQAVTASSSRQLYWERHRIFPAPFINMKCLTSEDVKKVEKFVVKAQELVAKVAAYQDKISNNPHHMPLVRLLLQGKSIRYETRQGNETRKFCIHPVPLEDRGVEAALLYKYSEDTRPGEDFTIQLFLRFRESTDIVGIAIQCFKSLQSQLKLLQYKSAIGELQLLAGSQGTVTSSRARLDAVFEARYIQSTLRSRPNSFCCEARVRGPRANSTVVSSGLSGMFPEEVIMFDFSCIAGTAVNYNFGSTSKDVMPPLEVNLTFSPHRKSRGIPGGVVLLEDMVGRKERTVVPRLQQFLKIVESNATKCFAHQQHLKRFRAWWRGNHGAAHIVVEKSIVLGAMRHCIEAMKVKPWAKDPEMDDNQVLSLVSSVIQARLSALIGKHI